MLTLLINLLAYLSFNERVEMSKKFIKVFGMKTKLSTDLPPEIYPSLNDAVQTVLFKKGKNLTQINNISDAIIHCRGCSGKAIPAGPGLLKEMTYFETYKELFDPENGTIARKLYELLNTSSAKSDEGNLTGSGSQVLNCLTLGHYVPKYTYNIPYKCTIKGNLRTCTAEGNASFSGTDKWDFESLQSNSFWENLITETIPGILVSLKGPAIPFDIPYEDTVHYKIEKTDQIATEKPTSVIQTPTSNPTKPPSTPVQTATKLVTSQPITESLSISMISQTTSSSSKLVTSQPPTQEVYVTSLHTSESSSMQNGQFDSSNMGKKKKKTGVIVAVVVVCVVVVAILVVGAVWILKKKRDQQLRMSGLQGQIADQTTMEMALI